RGGGGGCGGLESRGGPVTAPGPPAAPGSPPLETGGATRGGAEFLADVAEGEGLHLGVQERDRHSVAYAKGLPGIRDLLLAAGANDLVLVLEERAVLAATRSQANRLANADHANLVRTSRAAQKQLHAVERLQRLNRLETLPFQLRDIADLRRDHPSLSVGELAKKSNPPVSKATAYRRLQKLIYLADE